jgi:hypothetical protein
MPFTLDPSVINAMDDGAVAHAWLLDLFTDEGTLRAWDKPFPVNYLSNTYEALCDSWEISGEIKLGSDLVPEPLTFTFDGSADENDSSFAGRLVDRSWHQRRIKLTGLLFVPGQNFLTPIGPHLEWFGTMDTMEKVELEGSQSRIVMSCEGGIFRALDRNMTTCTHSDQQRRDSADLFFQNVALKPQQDVPFGRAWGTIPGGSGRGDVGSGGGGSLTGGGARSRIY